MTSLGGRLFFAWFGEGVGLVLGEELGEGVLEGCESIVIVGWGVLVAVLQLILLNSPKQIMKLNGRLIIDKRNTPNFSQENSLIKSGFNSNFELIYKI
jgi:hypothetical protein